MLSAYLTPQMLNNLVLESPSTGVTILRRFRRLIIAGSPRNSGGTAFLLLGQRNRLTMQIQLRDVIVPCLRPFESAY